MPRSIKFAAIALIISCVFSVAAIIAAGMGAESLGFRDPYSLFFGVIWIPIILWVLWLLTKKRSDIRVTLALVSVIMFLGLIGDTLDTFPVSSIFRTFEFVSWLIAFAFLNTKESKDWFQPAQTHISEEAN